MDNEKPTCSKKRKVGDLKNDDENDTNTSNQVNRQKKSPYNVWKKEPAALVPLKTLERWEQKQRKSLPEAIAQPNLIMEHLDDSDDSDAANDVDSDSSDTDRDECLDEYEYSDSDSDSNSGGNESESETESDNADSESTTSNESDTSLNSSEVPHEISNNFRALYENSNISVDETVIKLLDILLKHKLPKAALKAQINLIASILPDGHKMPKTYYRFFKFVEEQAPPCSTIKHYFCRNCITYLPKDLNVCELCSDESTSYFYEIDMIEQIIRLFELNNLADKLMSTPFNQDFVADITDGSEYRRINPTRQKFDLTLIMYTDGISLIKSSKSHCWPLMFVIAELPPKIRYKHIITVGLWYDKKIKPPMNLFLRPFCEKLIKQQTIKWKNPVTGEINTSRLSAPLFIADAPARADILNVLSFNGEYGCNICEIKTVACENKSGKKLIRVYPYKKNLSLRTREKMEKQAMIVDQNEGMKHSKGVKGATIICSLPNIDISTCVLPEFMHSVLLGVAKQFLNVWINKKGEWKIKKHIEKIDKFLSNIRPLQKFGRMPRSLQNFYLFKATELFNWLLYYSLPTLNGIIDEKYFQHWILLVISIYNLLGQRVTITQIEQSEKLLDLFVKEISSLYSNRELSYNIHQLLHLGLIVRRWGPLWATSAFPFEDQNGLIAKSIHGTRDFQQEIINNVKIAQGATAMKNRIGCTNSDVITDIEFLGNNKVFKANSFQKDLINSRGIDLKSCLFYDRAKIKNVIFTSTLYKITKTNNFTVKIKLNNDDDIYAFIACFIKTNTSAYLLIQHLNLIQTERFKHSSTNSIVKHIIPFKITNDFKILKINDILSINYILQVESYICKPLNTYNTII